MDTAFIQYLSDEASDAATKRLVPFAQRLGSAYAYDTPNATFDPLLIAPTDGYQLDAAMGWSPFEIPGNAPVTPMAFVPLSFLLTFSFACSSDPANNSRAAMLAKLKDAPSVFQTFPDTFVAMWTTITRVHQRDHRLRKKESPMLDIIQVTEADGSIRTVIQPEGTPMPVGGVLLNKERRGARSSAVPGPVHYSAVCWYTSFLALCFDLEKFTADHWAQYVLGVLRPRVIPPLFKLTWQATVEPENTWRKWSEDEGSPMYERLLTLDPFKPLDGYPVHLAKYTMRMRNLRSAQCHAVLRRIDEWTCRVQPDEAERRAYRPKVPFASVNPAPLPLREFFVRTMHEIRPDFQVTRLLLDVLNVHAKHFKSLPPLPVRPWVHDYLEHLQVGLAARLRV